MSILFAVGIMLLLCLLRFNVIIALIIGALIGGLSAHLSLTDILFHFSTGVSNSANIALSYALLGTFANALSHSGLASQLANYFKNTLKNNTSKKTILLFTLLLISIASQNLIPIHIAFIPIIIPPLLTVFNQLQLDRRLIACILTFGITCTYIILPIGFGEIYLKQILGGNLALQGIQTTTLELIQGMLIPASGMLIGLCLAVFFSYRKPRQYPKTNIIEKQIISTPNKTKTISILFTIASTVLIQVLTHSLIFAALSGFCFMMILRIIPYKNNHDIFMEGLKLMAPCGFIMMAASGFAVVLQQNDSMSTLVQCVSQLMIHKTILIFMLLCIGLVITIGIGSSFATIPILASVYVPLASDMGLSTLATIALIGTAGALGDAGSPASESTIGPSIGLNVDGAHDHLKDTVFPTFLHFNIPLLLFGWISCSLLL
ncbi:MAG: sodium:proton antiporter [Endozoicomonadaceae bacterium]|nr:sodium:proton antiporter [Endozoicomonadaceae bacterium]